MNKIYKSIYNAVRGVWVVVSEATSCNKQQSKEIVDRGRQRCSKCIATMFLLLFLSPPTWSSLSFGGHHFKNVTNDGKETWVLDVKLPHVVGDLNINFVTSSSGTQYDFDFKNTAFGSFANFTHDTSATVSFRDGNIDAYFAEFGHRNKFINSGSGTLQFLAEKKAVISGLTNDMADFELLNTGNGDILVQSVGETRTFDCGGGYGKVIVSNESSGTIQIIGFDNGSTDYEGAMTGLAWGQFALDHSEGSGIFNKGNGKIYIKRAFYEFGQSGASIINEGSGEIYLDEFAIGYPLTEFGEEGLSIANKGGGIFTIMGHAISALCDGSNIENSQNSTFKLLGSNGKYAIGEDSSPFIPEGANYTDGNVHISNAGHFILNSTSLKGLDPNPNGTKSFINYSTGTVSTEAGLLFSGQYDDTSSITPTPIDIVFVRNGAVNITQSDSFMQGGTQTGSVTLRDDWKTLSQWDAGGTINFTDIVNGTALAESIREQFQAAFGTGTTINFTGTGSSGSSNFTRSIVNALITEGKLIDGDIITSEALLLDKEEFKLSSYGGTFVFNAMGFKGILGATDIAVQDGKRLTLMGDMVSMAMAARATDAKPTNRITDSAMTLTNGHLNLGIESMTATGGVLSAITNDAQSTVSVNNGVYVFESLTGDGQLNVGAKGQVYLTGTDNTIANAGHLTIEQAFTLKDKGSTFAKIDAPEFRNEGTVVMQDFTVEEGAEFRNVKNGTTTAKAMKLNAGSSLTNLGTLTVDSLTGWGAIRNKGTLNVNGQLFVPGQSTQVLAGTVSASDLVIGETSQSQEASLLALNPTGTLMIQGQTFAKNMTFNSGNVQVVEGGTLTQGMDKEAFEKFEKDHKDLVKDKTVLVVDKNFSMGENDSLWVAEDLSDKNLALGDKSLVVLTGNNLKGQAMFESKDGTQLSASIAQGAQFVFEGETLGRHYIAKGFDEASQEAFKNLTITDLDNNKAMEVGANQNGVYVVNGTDDISTIAPNALFKSAFNYVLDAHQDTESDNAVVAWISKLISQKGMTDQSLTMVTMSLAQTLALAGVQQQGLSRGLAMADELKADHAKDGLLWANVLHTKSDVSGFDLGKGLEADYDVKGNGLVVGAELPLSNSFAIGTAVSYQKAKVEATGLQNEAETVAGSIYAKERVGAFNFLQSVTVAKTNHEVKGFNSTDVDTQAFVLDLEGAYTHGFANEFAVEPYAGLRASMLKVDDSAIAMAGKDVVKHEGDTDTFLQMPVGVKLQKAIETQNGWRVMGQAKLGAITTIGDTEAHSKVSAIGLNGTDALTTQVLDRTVGDLGVNVMAGNKTVQMGVGYNFQGSSSVKDHRIRANLKYIF